MREVLSERFMEESVTGTSSQNQELLMTFHDISEDITYDILQMNKKHILSAEAKAFIRVRSERYMSRGYLTYRDVPALKDDVFTKLVSIRSAPVKERFFRVAPVMPVEE